MQMRIYSAVTSFRSIIRVKILPSSRDTIDFNCNPFYRNITNLSKSFNKKKKGKK